MASRLLFGNKGGVGLSSDALWRYLVGLIYRRHAVSFKSTYIATVVEPQQPLDAHRFITCGLPQS